MQIQKIDNFHSASTQELKQELGRALDITADYLSYLAQIWRELESRGEDLSSLRGGLMSYLPMIANNRVDAHIVVNYAGQKTLLAALTKLPIEEQRRVAESGYVTVARSDEDGHQQEMQVKLTELRSADIHRVFSDSGIRTPEQQAKEQATIENKKPRKHITSIVHFDRYKDDDLLVISGKRVRVSDVIDALCDRYAVSKSDRDKIKSIF